MEVNNLNKSLFNLYYALISHYLQFSDVSDTLKDISEGISYLQNYPQNPQDFFAKQDDIIRYIVKARVDNLIYVYRNSRQIPIPGLPGKSLRQATSNELFVELEDVVSLLALKGIHQTIKHLYPMLNDNNLSDELLQQDISVIQGKYGLR